MTTYEWRKWSRFENDPWWGLLPEAESNNYSTSRIASIYRRGDGRYIASYYYPQSTGNKQGDGAVHKTLRGAQRWIERQLAKFWEPPTISNPIS